MVYGRLPRKHRRRAGPKRRMRKRVRKAGVAPINTASLRENFQASVPDGSVVYNRTFQLSNATFDRAQAVAQAYQEYCIKSVKLIFRPSADTFTPAAGNTIPQLYYITDKSGAVPTNANLQTLLDMGVRPIRFDSRNIIKSYKPVALIGADTNAAGLLQAGVISKPSPWLATNANAGAPSGAWAPSQVEHGGCVWLVTKLAPLTPTINYTVDIELVFCFRKPLWRQGVSPTAEVNMTINGDGITPLLTH